MIIGLLELESGNILWNKHAIDDSEDYYSELSYVGHKDGLKAERTAIVIAYIIGVR
jgi:ABC-type transport system involved in cytochrome c biogenesis ATPase subunit